MRRMTIFLEGEVKEVIFQIAEREKRDPRLQAAYILRQALEEGGYLPITNPNPQQQEANYELTPVCS